MVKYQRMPQKSKGGQGDKNQGVQGEGHWNDPVCLWHKKKVSEMKNGWSKVQVLQETTDLAQRDTVLWDS